jgi:glycosyltransferase involved in cell wall biosynthesis
VFVFLGRGYQRGAEVKVSVITVCLNSAETIEDTIRSVMLQDHKDIEYIVVTC